jgi:hypothetical protein
MESRLYDMYGYTLLLVMICCIFQLDGITTVRHAWLHIVVSNDMLYFSVGWNHDCHDMHGYTLLFSNDMLYFSVGWNHDCTTCMVTHCC